MPPVLKPTEQSTREPSSDPNSDDALPNPPYQELLKSFRQRDCISINIAELDPDGSFGRLDNGFNWSPLSYTRVLINNWSHNIYGGYDSNV